MPNGHSGFKNITRKEFIQLLRELPDGTRIGELFSVKNKVRATVTTSDVMSLLEEKRDGVFCVEEQDHAWYLVHLGEWGTAVTVDESSPLHPTLRRHLSLRGS